MPEIKPPIVKLRSRERPQTKYAVPTFGPEPPPYFDLAHVLGLDRPRKPTYPTPETVRAEQEYELARQAREFAATPYQRSVSLHSAGRIGAVDPLLLDYVNDTIRSDPSLSMALDRATTGDEHDILALKQAVAMRMPDSWLAESNHAVDRLLSDPSAQAFLQSKFMPLGGKKPTPSETMRLLKAASGKVWGMTDPSQAPSDVQSFLLTSGIARLPRGSESHPHVQVADRLPALERALGSGSVANEAWRKKVRSGLQAIRGVHQHYLASAERSGELANLIALREAATDPIRVSELNELILSKLRDIQDNDLTTPSLGPRKPQLGLVEGEAAYPDVLATSFGHDAPPAPVRSAFSPQQAFGTSTRKLIDSIDPATLADPAQQQKVARLVDIWQRYARRYGMGDLDMSSAQPIGQQMLSSLLSSPEALSQYDSVSLGKLMMVADIRPDVARGTHISEVVFGRLESLPLRLRRAPGTLLGASGTYLAPAEPSDMAQMALQLDLGDLSQLAYAVKSGAVRPPSFNTYSSDTSVAKSMAQTMVAVNADGGQHGFARVAAAYSATFPDQAADVMSESSGYYGAYSHGLEQRGAREAADTFYDLSSAFPRKKGFTFYRQMDVSQRVDPSFARGLARASNQYVLDPDVARRPPLGLKEGQDYSSSSYQGDISAAFYRPYEAWTSWWKDPSTQRVIDKVRAENPDISDVAAIQQAITSGWMAEPTLRSERGQFEVRKSVLREMWKLAIDDNNFTTTMVRTWKRMGIRVPEPIKRLAESPSDPVAKAAARVAMDQIEPPESVAGSPAESFRAAEDFLRD